MSAVIPSLPFRGVPRSPSSFFRYFASFPPFNPLSLLFNFFMLKFSILPYFPIFPSLSVPPRPSPPLPVPPPMHIVGPRRELPAPYLRGGRGPTSGVQHWEHQAHGGGGGYDHCGGASKGTAVLCKVWICGGGQGNVPIRHDVECIVFTRNPRDVCPRIPGLGPALGDLRLGQHLRR